MPNHVHLLITPLAPIPQITKSIKNDTSRFANQLLNRSGRFWQEETFDRSVWTEAEFNRIATYIANNPVKAGLVTPAGEYQWCG